MGRRRAPPHLTVVVALLADGLLLLADAATRETFTTVYLVPVLGLAVVATVRVVARMAALAVVLATVSGFWHDMFLTVGHPIRVAIVICGGALAIVCAEARERAVAARDDADSAVRRLDSILGALAEAVTVNDETGHTRYANPAAVRLLGAASLQELVEAEPGDLAGRFSITKEDGSPVTLADLPGQRVAGDDAGAVTTLLTRSIHRETGAAYWLLTKSTATVDASGRRLAINIIEDVTSAKDAEVRLRFLAGAEHLLADSLDYEQTLERVARLAVPVLADWCAVDLGDGAGGLTRVAVEHSDPDKVAFARRLDEQYPADLEAERGAGALLRGGPAQLYPEIPDALLADSAVDEEHLALLRSVGMRSAMIAPMRIRDRTIGVMTFVSAESGRVFTPGDLAFAEDLARRAAVAIENSRLYRDRTRTARTLQASLLPDALPEVPGFALAADYAPGDVTSDVGGDFYDVFPVAGGRMLILGDVTGKGVEAAALTALVRHTAKTAARFDPMPSRVLGVVDDVLLDQPVLSMVTMVCALLPDADGPAAARLIVAVAGHPLPLVRRADGSVTACGSPGTLLGATAAGTRTDDEVRLGPGDTILLYTDGVTDTPGPDGRFGDERLRALLAQEPGDPASIVRRVAAATGRFQRAGGADDRALLALGFTGAGLAGPVPGGPG